MTHQILGLHVPDAGALFTLTLLVHVVAGLSAVLAGALAATACKRPGRHPRAGRVYLCALATVVATAALLTAIRPRADAKLLAIATTAMAMGLFGWHARRARRPGWPARHAAGLGGSYIALLTGFYVDNGAQLPLWNRFPHWTYWVLPTAVGVPLILWALRRFQAGVSGRPRAANNTTPSQIGDTEPPDTDRRDGHQSAPAR